MAIRWTMSAEERNPQVGGRSSFESLVNVAIQMISQGSNESLGSSESRAASSWLCSTCLSLRDRDAVVDDAAMKGNLEASTAAHGQFKIA